VILHKADIEDVSLPQKNIATSKMEVDSEKSSQKPSKKEQKEETPSKKTSGIKSPPANPDVIDLSVALKKKPAKKTSGTPKKV